MLISMVKINDCRAFSPQWDIYRTLRAQRTLWKREHNEPEECHDMLPYKHTIVTAVMSIQQQWIHAQDEPFNITSPPQDHTPSC